MLITAKKQLGLSLIELMIGLLVGSIISAGAISAFNNTLKGSADNMNLSRLNQNMRIAMDIMVRDIRRAGYVVSDPTLNDVNGDGINDALMNNSFAPIGIENIASNGDCITYMYNSDYKANNGVANVTEIIPVIDTTERLGFKLSGTNLMMRRASPTISCASGTWNTLNEPEIEITNVTFTLIETAFNITSMITDANNDGRMDGDDNNNKICDAGEVCRTCVINPVAPSPACNFARAVTISLTGRIKSDTTISQTLTEEVRVRNDQFFPAK